MSESALPIRGDAAVNDLSKRSPDTSGIEQTVDRHETAKILGCSADHITNLIRKGRIPATDIGTGRIRYYRIKPSDIARFQAAAAPAPEASTTRRGRNGKALKPLA